MLQDDVLSTRPNRWAETTLSDKDMRAGLHPMESMRGIDSTGVVRTGTQSDLMVKFVETERPLIGGRCFCIEEPGIYVLAQGEGTLRSFLCSHGYCGSFEIYDVGYAVDENPSEPLEYRVLTQARQIRKLVNMAPPILGQFPLDGNFKNGLVVRVTCLPSQSTIFTVVWFLYADLKNGNGSGS